MRAVFSHRPVPPIRVVASKKEKKAGSACTLDIIAELNRGVRGGLLVLGQHDLHILVRVPVATSPDGAGEVCGVRSCPGLVFTDRRTHS